MRKRNGIDTYKKRYENSAKRYQTMLAVDLPVTLYYMSFHFLLVEKCVLDYQTQCWWISCKQNTQNIGERWWNWNELYQLPLVVCLVITKLPYFKWLLKWNEIYNWNGTKKNPVRNASMFVDSNMIHCLCVDWRAFLRVCIYVCVLLLLIEFVNLQKLILPLMEIIL